MPEEQSTQTPEIPQIPRSSDWPKTILIALTGLALLTATTYTGYWYGTQQVSDSIEEVAAEFRSLRMIKGHFEGGTSNDDLDNWMGRKHQLMIQLGSRLGTGEYSKAQVVQLLDPPDLIARKGDDFFDLADAVNKQIESEKPGTDPYELLIYYWRGTHDVFYFTYQGETIINSDWWYALE